MAAIRSWKPVYSRGAAAAGLLLAGSLMAAVMLAHPPAEHEALRVPAGRASNAPVAPPGSAGERKAAPFQPIKTGVIRNEPLRPGIERGRTPAEAAEIRRLKALRQENLKRKTSGPTRESLIARGIPPGEVDKLFRRLRIMKSIGDPQQEKKREHPVWTREGLIERGFPPEEAEELLESHNRIKQRNRGRTR